MIKACASLAFLIVLTAVSQGQDYLDGGYVSSGDNGDIGQYFTDPIFTSPGGHYASTSPVIPRRAISVGYTGTKSAATKVTPNTPIANAAGNWYLELSDGTSVDLSLYESGNVVFGQGKFASAMASQLATSNGIISGNSMRLAIVPSSGTILYIISLDILNPSLGGSYTAFSADGQTKSGAARANRFA